MSEEKYAEGLQRVLSSVSGKRDENTLVFIKKIIDDQYSVNPKNNENHQKSVSIFDKNKIENKKIEDRKSKKIGTKKSKIIENKNSLSFGFKNVSDVGNVSDIHLNGIFDKFQEEKEMNIDVDIIDVDDKTPESESDSESDENQMNLKNIHNTRDIIGLIPKENKKLFDFVLDWNVVDKAGIIDEIMKKWLNDRFCEYLGQEEEDLVKFVIKLLKQHQSVRQIITQLRMVLDKDTEQFVVKMWRRLVFETLKVIYSM